jgi:HAMP domain-containing protein
MIVDLNLPEPREAALLALAQTYNDKFVTLAENKAAIDTNLSQLELIAGNQRGIETAAAADFEAIERVSQVVDVILVALATIVGIVFAVFIQRGIVKSLSSVTGAAEQLQKGDLEARADIYTQDEIGVLGRTFNQMAEQIGNLVSGLEGTVAERTSELAAAVEVGGLITRIQNQSELLPTVVDFIRVRFNLYYTQIYLVDEARRNAVLRAGTGEVGQQLLARRHQLNLSETSLVAQAVRSGAPVLVADTTTSTTHRPNDLLPDTRSEVAIPLMIGGNILGVLDMQTTTTCRCSRRWRTNWRQPCKAHRLLKKRRLLSNAPKRSTAVSQALSGKVIWAV